MEWYLLAFAAIFAVNLLPAFGPPTWSVLVAFKLGYDLAPVPLVLGGALCAATGRYCLALGSRRFRGRMSEERLEHLEAARDVVEGGGTKSVAGLALFALSPVPSAQLFVAAGLLDVRLGRLTLAFFSGRLVSYSIYVGGATLASRAFEDVLTGAFTSPVGIATQLAMVALVVALLKVDWAKLLTRRRAARPPDGP